MTATATLEPTQTARESRRLYNPAGWTVTSGVWTILADCRDHMRSDLIPAAYGMPPREQIIDGRPLEEYTPFHDLGSNAAAKLLEVLPAATLTERQNLGPSLGACLAAAAGAAGRVRLSGYAIGPQRHDERVTVEGMWIADPDLLDLNLCGIHGKDCDCRQVWDTIRTRYSLDARHRPDEIRHARRYWNEGPKGTWIWWD